MTSEIIDFESKVLSELKRFSEKPTGEHKASTKSNGAAREKAIVTLDDFAAYMPTHGNLQADPGDVASIKCQRSHSADRQDARQCMVRCKSSGVPNDVGPRRADGNPKPSHFRRRMDREIGLHDLQLVSAVNDFWHAGRRYAMA